MKFTINGLSELSGVDRRSVKRLMADTPADNGEYTLKAFLTAFVRSRSNPIHREKLLKIETERKILELNLEERRGGLVDIEDFS